MVEQPLLLLLPFCQALHAHQISDKEKQENDIGRFLADAVADQDKVFFSQATEGKAIKYDPISPLYIRKYSGALAAHNVDLYSSGNPNRLLDNIIEAKTQYEISLSGRVNREVLREKVKDIYQATSALEDQYLCSEHGLLSRFNPDKKNYLIAPAQVVLFGKTRDILLKRKLEYCFITNWCGWCGVGPSRHRLTVRYYIQ